MTTHQLSMFDGHHNDTHWIIFREDDGEMVPVTDDDGEVRRFESEEEAEKERGWFDVVAARREQGDDRNAD